ncbi:VIT1/CCC1 transporter family protein [Clostridium intestinale]|uniref:Predicted Fe2+/Mn2+ transporter, VIT1/CCC1 family n=1 Tax=Clostridium intestinale DSM 6191 TaxID=1121320 RepID=A0A1M5YMB5_9CLOT|nr:VIT1/CCC1 transporter family protein [Clostridium intestinale]SHI13049.1 Predicted Fe2+/Mn2+ transporter, VIT1/CCC1 family [Clostridium intestinale DSM 6191]
MENLRLMEVIKKYQRDEKLEYYVYLKIAKFVKDKNDHDMLLKIADEEYKHYNIWKQYTKCDVEPNMFIVYWYVFMARLLGYTFVIKNMENKLRDYNSDNGIERSMELIKLVPRVEEIFKDEIEHEEELIAMIDEEKLRYVGSMVLGLNDALVEFTGSLAGWTFAMQSNNLILLAGLITGISATLSMASSEYLSVKNEGGKDALKSSVYTGIAYLLTVVILLLPYMILGDSMYVQALLIMLFLVILIIATFNYYISVAKSISFKKKFLEMSSISLSVAVVSFIIGLLVKRFLGIDI